MEHQHAPRRAHIGRSVRCRADLARPTCKVWPGDGSVGGVVHCRQLSGVVGWRPGRCHSTASTSSRSDARRGWVHGPRMHCRVRESRPSLDGRSARLRSSPGQGMAWHGQSWLPGGGGLCSGPRPSTAPSWTPESAAIGDNVRESGSSAGTVPAGCDFQNSMAPILGRKVAWRRRGVQI